MRTIRWRNGQCPGRNGQWAERIAHAGSGAVRLVPFSAAAVFPRVLRSPALLALRVLLPLLLIQLDRFHHGLSGMAELRDVSRYRGEFFQLIACRQRTSLGALGGTPQNSLLSAAFAQRWSSSQSGSKFEHSCAHWRPRVVAGAEIRAARPHREA